MNITLKADTPKTFNITVRDKKGHVIDYAGAVAAISSDASVVVARVSDDFKSITFAYGDGDGALGSATVTVTDAAGNLTCVASVTVEAGAPDSIRLEPCEE